MSEYKVVFHRFNFWLEFYVRFTNLMIFSSSSFFFHFTSKFYSFISIQRNTICCIIWFNLDMTALQLVLHRLFISQYFLYSLSQNDNKARITFSTEIEFHVVVFFSFILFTFSWYFIVYFYIPFSFCEVFPLWSKHEIKYKFN